MNIVVSGASQGIGMEIVKIFLQKGHEVLAIARNKAKLKQLQKDYQKVNILAADLSEIAFKSKFESEVKEWKRIDCVINNAGQLINKAFIETSADDFLNQYQSNVITAVNLIQGCLPKLNQGAHILNITSMGGIQGSSKFPGLSAYSASKGALSVLTECLAEELKEKGINVNALALGAVQTEMLEKAFPEYKAPVSASEMGEYIVDFALKGSRFFNGQVLNVALGNP